MVQYARHGLREMIADGVDILFCNEHEARLWAESDESPTAHREAETAKAHRG